MIAITHKKFFLIYVYLCPKKVEKLFLFSTDNILAWKHSYKHNNIIITIFAFTFSLIIIYIAIYTFHIETKHSKAYCIYSTAYSTINDSRFLECLLPKINIFPIFFT